MKGRQSMSTSIRTNLNSAPFSDRSTGGLSITEVHPWVSPWRKWALTAFCASAATSIIFCILAFFTQREFSRVIDDLSTTSAGSSSTTLAGISVNAWISLFMGAAVSAVFAFVLSIITIALSALLLCCARKSVAHPARPVSKSFLLAAAWFTAAHVANITVQFHSYAPMMGAFEHELGASFNTRLLTATIVFGYLSAACYVLFGLVLLPWREHPELLTVERAPAGPTGA